MRTQMTVDKTDALIDKPASWRAIDWQRARRVVRRLQVRIAKAIREGNRRKAKDLQWMLTHSFYAKALAVKRVSSNKGRHTPGVDGAVWHSARAKMLAATRLQSTASAPMLHSEEEREETSAKHPNDA